MNENNEIIFFTKQNNKSPILDFIKKQKPKNQSKIYYALELLREFGLKLGMPHLKKLKSVNLWELRTLGESNIRIFFCKSKKNEYLVVNIFDKKSNKTPIKEIKTSLKRAQIYTCQI